jgi:hypothetical protein
MGGDLEGGYPTCESGFADRIIVDALVIAFPDCIGFGYARSFVTARLAKNGNKNSR